MTPTPLSYQDAGVNIDAGNQLVERIKSVAQRTHRPGVLAGLGGFGALFELPQGYQQPVLVSSTDGVGTKLKLALALGQHQHIGIDLVAMCVNDLVVCGAEPLFFLDYYATGQLDLDTAAAVISSIGRGCELAGCALTGGETAEMPGMYAADEYDLAGFAVGIVEKARIIDGQQVACGDAIIGLPSSGAHANGYSLIRRVLERSNSSLDQPFDGSTLGEVLLRPTQLYVKPLLSLQQQVAIHAMAHITGGGLLENIPRVLPSQMQARITPGPWPELFHWLQTTGQISTPEMYRTFNCGIGMVVVVPQAQAQQAVAHLQQQQIAARVIGQIEPREDLQQPQVVIV